MGALGGVNGGFWGLPPFGSHHGRNRRRSRSGQQPNSHGSPESSAGFRFPLKQAVTAGSLALTGDTIAQLQQRWKKKTKALGDEENPSGDSAKDVVSTLISDHDWLRSLRMASYGFLLYGPGSYAWYQYLDHCMPKQSTKTILLKVLLNQIVLGPCVIAVVFAWNNLWLGKVAELPNKYQKDALPTLFSGFRFWIPVSILNFWIVPLQARVGFMSMGSIFWNFCLSSTMSK